ncbi:cytochrome P450 [Streptomonospora halophila]|uniref:cytochrome P450 n=1 Tax=Streptomonospora halophila TaxID=427369 RepID=UPI0031EB0ABF
MPADHPVAAMVGLDNMLTADGADHRRLRGLISQAFTPGRIGALRPAICGRAEKLVEELALAAGPVDVKAAFAYPLSQQVFGDLFGIGETDHGRIRAMVDTAFSTAPPDEVRAMRAEVDAYLDEVIAAKQDMPGSDVVSALIGAREGGERLSTRELRDTLWLLLTAGYETTASALANGIETLLGSPEQLARLCAGEAAWLAAVEEILRAATSVATLPFLFASEDVTVAGHTIAAGEAVLLCYLAANRDPARYGEAQALDLGAMRPRHLGLGHGPHVCLGAALARAELEIGLSTLFARFPRARRVEPAPPRLGSVFINSPAALPVHLEPAAA